MRGNGQEGNAIVAVERASSQKILDEAPSSTRVDEMAHQSCDGDGDGVDEKNEDDIKS